MKKKLFLLSLLLLTSTFCISQNIQVKGTVKDAASGEVLSHITITTENRENATVTNTDGNFALTCHENTGKIILSSIGYAETAYVISGLPNDDMYLMEPTSIEMEEIIVINIPINVFLEKLVKSSVAGFTSPLQLSTYYREFVKNNSTYTRFSDGLIDYNLYRKGRKIDTEIIVKQSRAAKLPQNEEETLDVVSPLDVRKAVSKDYAFKPIDLLLDKKAYNKYNFTIKSQQNNSGQIYEVIYFEPMDDVHEALYKGTIVYDPKTNRILDIDMNMAESHKKYIKEINFLIAHASLLDLSYKSSFTITDNRYMLALSLRDVSMNIRTKKLNENFKFKSDLVVTNFTSDVVKFNKKEKYKEKSLYENGNKYSGKFWLGSNSILLTVEEEAIIKSLESEN